MKSTLAVFLLVFILSCNEHRKKENHQIIIVKKAMKSPTIDGQANENDWHLADWHPIDQSWIGMPLDHHDFNGRYKLIWDENHLYALIEITDDVLFDQYKDPLKLWWNDDFLQVFLDADNSGGLHQYSYNAFAYHIALDGMVVDLGPSKEPQLYNSHIKSKRITEGTTSTWEIAINIYDDTFDDKKQNKALKLKKKQKVGFALAYGDNDGSEEKENFIGSVFVKGEDKNQGWINADIFGTLIFKE